MERGRRAPPSPSRKRPRKSVFVHAIAGTCSGLIATSLLHPLDLVKTRFQVFEGTVGLRAQNSSAYKSSLALGRSIVAQHGLRSLYNGIAPALLGSGVSWGLYWLFYENAKARHRESIGPGARLGTLQHLASSTEAGVTCVLITHPIWLLKTRLQLQTTAVAKAADLAAMPPSQRPYLGMVDAVSRIVREEGVLALYKGVVPALLLVSHGVVQFCIYEKLKERARGGVGLQPGTLEFFVMGATSKVVATTVTYPYQVIKSRIQQRQIEVKYTGTLSTAATMFRSEGLRGFYKGLGPNLLRVAPNAAITFSAYEKIVALLQGVGRGEAR